MWCAAAPAAARCMTLIGNLNYSFITDVGDHGISIRRFTCSRWWRRRRSLGLNAEACGRNDILVEGRKVSGTAQRRHGGRILHHGTLLFDANPGMVAGALHVDPEKNSSYKSTKSVRSRIGNIRGFSPAQRHGAARLLGLSEGRAVRRRCSTARRAERRVAGGG